MPILTEGLPELIREATAAYESGNHNAALEYVSAARKMELTDSGDALELGYLSLNLNKIPDALDCFTTAVRLDGKTSFTHASRSLALQLLGRTTEATQSAQSALSLDANDLIALKVLANINIQQGKFVEADALCRRLLTIAPNDSDAKAISQQCNSVVGRDPRAALFSNGAINKQQPTVLKAAANPAQRSKLDGLLGDYSTRCEAWDSLGVEHLMQQLVVGDFKKPIAVVTPARSAGIGSDGLPVPPVELTMGYGAGDLDHYLACGRKSYESLTDLLKQHEVSLNSGDALLDWGGAAGRVVRNFTSEVRNGCEVWGCDVHTPSIQWAQHHLSPPFRFFNSSALPHLPFADGKFKFIYGLSVMTHMIALRDLWLLELNRVLAADGCVILTVHNEATWQWFRDHQYPAWMPNELRQLSEMPGECVEVRGSRWEHVYTFFHSNYLRRVWGQFFQISDIVPCAEGYQTAVVMKKR